MPIDGQFTGNVNHHRGDGSSRGGGGAGEGEFACCATTKHTGFEKRGHANAEIPPWTMMGKVGNGGRHRGRTGRGTSLVRNWTMIKIDQIAGIWEDKMGKEQERGQRQPLGVMEGLHPQNSNIENMGK